MTSWSKGLSGSNRVLATPDWLKETQEDKWDEKIFETLVT